MKLQIPNYNELGYSSHKTAALDIANRAAEEVNVRLDRPRVANGRWIMFLLKTLAPEHMWKKKSPRTGRTIPGRVCWHGYGTFFREIYKIASEAKIVTGIGAYQDERDFLTNFIFTYAESGHNMNSAFESSCLCEEMIATFSDEDHAISLDDHKNLVLGTTIHKYISNERSF